MFSQTILANWNQISYDNSLWLISQIYISYGPTTWWTMPIYVSLNLFFSATKGALTWYYDWGLPFQVSTNDPNLGPTLTSVRPHHFRSITWVFIHGIFSNFAYILLSAMSGMGLLMGKIRPFLTELLPFFVLEKWFLACYSFTIHDIWMKLHRYVAHQRLHILTKDRHSDHPSLWVIRPW